MKSIILWLLLLSSGYSLQLHAQNYFTKNGKVSFSSKTSIETIQAVNNQVLAIIAPATRQVAFNLLVRGFLFEKQLMQDHFNEEVLESGKYPKASFTGKITDNIDLTKPGKYQVHLTGKLTMHGITKPLTTAAELIISPGQLSASCQFEVTYTDYNIKMPSVLQNNIAKSITISVQVDCTPMNK